MSRVGFHYPTGVRPRIAVLHSRVRWSGDAKSFPDGWGRQAARFKPQSLAGSRRALTQLAREVLRREVPAPGVTHSVIVMSDWMNDHLVADDRDLLWDAFEVPIFEQVLSPEGALLASECDAHEGLHCLSDVLLLDSDGHILRRNGATEVRTGLQGRMEHGNCPCGWRGPRIMDVRFVRNSARAAGA